MIHRGTYLPRYPIEPLLFALRRWLVERDVDHTTASAGPSVAFQELAGVNQRRAQRWMSEGMIIGTDNADRVASSLGLHPSLVWPALWWFGYEEEPGGTFCGRPLSWRAPSPHTCDTVDGCRCEIARKAARAAARTGHDHGLQEVA